MVHKFKPVSTDEFINEMDILCQAMENCSFKEAVRRLWAGEAIDPELAEWLRLARWLLTAANRTEKS